MSKEYKQRDRINKYVDLKINGRLFPSFVLKNFKKYKLDEVLPSGQDPCKTNTGETKLELKKYQIFLGQYLDYRSPYRSVLIYHQVGTGKTASAINIYNVLYNYNPQINVFILIKASLRGEWLDNLKMWLKKDEYNYRFKNIIFINYDSPFADRNFLDALKNVDSAKKSMYIIDEVHNFIRNVYSNVSSGIGRRAQVIYDYIIQDQKENPDTRVVAVSATPAINNPFELALLFNLLRPGIFPRSENEFNTLFISGGSYQTLSKKTKNMFQRRIMGLVSYYTGASVPGIYASQTTEYVDVEMSDYQQDIYNFYEEIEAKIAMRSAGRGGSTVYKTYTRQSANFVFPSISQKINGENRPRPSKFRLSEREAIKLSEGENIEGDNKAKNKEISEYLKVVNSYVDGFDRYMNEKNNEDIMENKRTIIKDIEIYLEKYKGDYNEFRNGEKEKSKVYELMNMCSAKMTMILFTIMKSPGPTVVYSNYVLMEGLEIFKIYLKYVGFYNYMIKKQFEEGKIGYVEFHGGIKKIEDRFKARDVFNMTENKYGTLIKILLVSPAGSEGLNLRNVRQIHIMEPYWNEVRITQIIGRGIRQCSHRDLPLDQRHVNIFRYKSVRPDKLKWTTDQYIEDLARSKEGLIQSFLDSMKEVAIDCGLNKNHNMISQEYKCFQFEEPSLFDKQIGPAYRTEIDDDMKIDNGSNSLKAMSLKIKVLKIYAVIKLSKENEPDEYSQRELYWLDERTRVVYDYDLHYQIGKISLDQDGIPQKIDKETFIIDTLIDIPVIT